MVFSVNDRVLIKLLRQEKEYGIKSLLHNFQASHGHCQDFSNSCLILDTLRF